MKFRWQFLIAFAGFLASFLERQNDRKQSTNNENLVKVNEKGLVETVSNLRTFFIPPIFIIRWYTVYESE